MSWSCPVDRPTVVVFGIHQGILQPLARVAWTNRVAPKQHAHHDAAWRQLRLNITSPPSSNTGLVGFALVWEAVVAPPRRSGKAWHRPGSLRWTSPNTRHPCAHITNHDLSAFCSVPFCFLVSSDSNMFRGDATRRALLFLFPTSALVLVGFGLYLFRTPNLSFPRPALLNNGGSGGLHTYVPPENGATSRISWCRLAKSC